MDSLIDDNDFFHLDQSESQTQACHVRLYGKRHHMVRLHLSVLFSCRSYIYIYIYKFLARNFSTAQKSPPTVSKQ